MLPSRNLWTERPWRRSSGRPRIAAVRSCGHSAIGRLVLHQLSRVEVETSLAACSIIEMYPDGHRPLPDCLVLTWLRANDPLHAVIAVDTPNDRVFVVTVYRPDPTRWSHGWTRRRS